MNRAAKISLTDARQSTAIQPKKAETQDFRTLRLRLYAVIGIADGLAMLAAFLIADLARFGAAQGFGVTTFSVMFPTYVAVGLNGDAWSIRAG